MFSIPHEQVLRLDNVLSTANANRQPDKGALEFSHHFFLIMTRSFEVSSAFGSFVGLALAFTCIVVAH